MRAHPEARSGGGQVGQLLDRFISPEPEFGPLPIWWWSGASITRDRLRWQMEQLVSQGVRQAVVMCLAPAGRDQPKIIAAVPEIIAFLLFQRWFERGLTAAGAVK